MGPTWLKLSSADVKEQIFKLAKRSYPISNWCYSQGFTWCRSSSICNWKQNFEILKSKGLAPDLPEDIYYLIKKAVSIRKHLDRNRKDRDAKFRLILIESRIHRLGRYYKQKSVLPPNWKYESATASAMVA